MVVDLYVYPLQCVVVSLVDLTQEPSTVKGLWWVEQREVLAWRHTVTRHTTVGCGPTNARSGDWSSAGSSKRLAVQVTYGVAGKSCDPRRS